MIIEKDIKIGLRQICIKDISKKTGYNVTVIVKLCKELEDQCLLYYSLI